MKKGQNGFAHVMVFLLLVVVAVVAVAGYEVISKNHKTDASATTVSGTVTLAPLPDNLSNLITPEKLSQVIEATANANAVLKNLTLHEVNGKPVFDATLSDGTRIAVDATTGEKVTPSKNVDSNASSVSIPASALKDAMGVATVKELAVQHKEAILAAIKANKVAHDTSDAPTPPAGTPKPPATATPTPPGTASASGTDNQGTANADKVLNIVLQNLQGTPAYKVVFRDGTTVSVPFSASVSSEPVAHPCQDGPIVTKDGKQYAAVLPSAATDHMSVVACAAHGATGPASRNPN